MTPTNVTEKPRGIYEDPKDIDSKLWEELCQLEVQDVCQRALVRYQDSLRCYVVPFLHQSCAVYPERRYIEWSCSTLHEPTFQLYLVLLTYLLRARPAPLSGRLVTASEIRGGSFFFRGPHVLFTEPLLQKFGSNAEAFLRAGRRLGGSSMDFGDVSFRLWPLPRIPLGYILWTADEEFSARLVVTFDSSVEHHLPLDVIWALVNVVGSMLLRQG
ncbi:MAG: DUF3786 domain-containing protein [Deltaproteobacteria bacterium]|nr:DUF3786 domain-containing protein [Deltaproteobacteria bacterium]MBW2070686.1 DUF3786 domain-containing protein [Deltaproteobacteria bacterium]